MKQNVNRVVVMKKKTKLIGVFPISVLLCCVVLCGWTCTCTCTCTWTWTWDLDLDLDLGLGTWDLDLNLDWWCRKVGLFLC